MRQSTPTLWLPYGRPFSHVNLIIPNSTWAKNMLIHVALKFCVSRGLFDPAYDLKENELSAGTTKDCSELEFMQEWCLKSMQLHNGWVCSGLEK